MVQDKIVGTEKPLEMGSVYLRVMSTVRTTEHISRFATNNKILEEKIGLGECFIF